MHTLNSILPLLLIIALGSLLAKREFLSDAFMKALNHAVFYLSLPALIISKLASATLAGQTLAIMIGVFVIATVLTMLFAYMTVHAFHVKTQDQGTVIQASFRANDAYVAIPILAYSFSSLSDSEQATLLGKAFLLLAPAMVIYNMLAVFVLQRSNVENANKGHKILLIRMLKNPLIIASVMGFVINITVGSLPEVIDRTLSTLGDMAIPGALLAIGGSLAHASLRDANKTVWIAVVIKLLVAPLVVWLIGLPFEFSDETKLILIIFAAAPTAVASHIMATQMGGNEKIAASSIALSTLLSPITLSLLLFVFA